MTTATAPQQFTPLELETRPTVDTAAYSHYMHIAPQNRKISRLQRIGAYSPLAHSWQRKASLAHC